jgi:hypothetical protein
VIVLHRHDQLLLVKQLDHAALAGHFAEAWGGADFEPPEPRSSVVLAAARHDEGWRESDDELRYDPARQAPLDFLDGAIEDYVVLYARGIQRIAELDPYAGVLVSMHGTGNVCGRWGIQPGIRLSGYDEATWPRVIERFVLEQEGLQAGLKIRLLGLRPAQRRSVFERRLWANWEQLQAWDRLSLFICRTDPEETAEADLGAVPTSLEGSETVSLMARSLGSSQAAIDPWPFAQPALQVVVPIVSIPERRYASQEEVRVAAAAATAQWLAWAIVPLAGTSA